MELVKQNDPILKQVCKQFDFENPVMDPTQLVSGMQAIRKLDGGVGLAAPQVGIDAQMLVIGMGSFETKGTEDFEMSFFNPVIKKYGEDTEYYIEGCLTFPGLYIKVKRPKEIVLSWQDDKQVHWEENFGGMTSRILQHEVDHLNGVVFLNRAHRHHLEKALKEQKLLHRRRKRNGRTL